jgi:hypothetical protein
MTQIDDQRACAGEQCYCRSQRLGCLYAIREGTQIQVA